MRLLPWAYCLMVATIFLLPFFSAQGYSLLQHTTSQLGAQHTPNAWVMNAVFVLLGIASIADGWKPLNGFVFHKVALVAFGLSLIGAAVCSHAPITAGIPFNALENQWHSVFASITGFAFTMLAIASGFTEPNLRGKLAAWGAAALATALSIAMFLLPAWAGLWQRGMFLVCIGWLWWFTARNTRQSVVG